MKQTKTKEERCAYVRGALGACEVMGVVPEVAAAVCQDLRITTVELKEFREEQMKNVKPENRVPRMQG